MRSRNQRRADHHAQPRNERLLERTRVSTLGRWSVRRHNSCCPPHSLASWTACVRRPSVPTLAAAERLEVEPRPVARGQSSLPHLELVYAAVSHQNTSCWRRAKRATDDIATCTVSRDAACRRPLLFPVTPERRGLAGAVGPTSDAAARGNVKVRLSTHRATVVLLIHLFDTRSPSRGPGM